MAPSPEPALKNFKLVLEYDGARFHGWQIQPGGRTIQGVLEQVAETITGQKTRLIASGRTDAGVHALAQVAHFKAKTRMDGPAMQRAFNSLAPGDVKVLSCEEVPLAFHALGDARGKTYRYHIHNSPLPPVIGRDYAWHIKLPLDVKAMNQAAQCLLGEHDFVAFQGVGSPRPTTVRTLTQAQWEVHGKTLVFTVQANGFLRYMVRNIVGTLVEVGRQRQQIPWVKSVLAGKNRKAAGPTAPGKGLFLVQVFY